ncbi:hypothetical protein Tco_0782345 [Tanacetum coccineum]
MCAGSSLSRDEWRVAQSNHLFGAIRQQLARTQAWERTKTEWKITTHKAKLLVSDVVQFSRSYFTLHPVTCSISMGITEETNRSTRSGHFTEIGRTYTNTLVQLMSAIEWRRCNSDVAKMSAGSMSVVVLVATTGREEDGRVYRYWERAGSKSTETLRREYYWYYDINDDRDEGVVEKPICLKDKQIPSEWEFEEKYPRQVDYKEMIEESVQANLINEVKNQLPKFLPKVVSDFVTPVIQSTVKNALEKNPLLVAQTSSQAQSSFKAAES